MRVRLLFLISVLVLLAGCSTDPKVACKKYVDNGNKYFNRGKYPQASIMYRRALSKDMRYSDAWYRLGLTNMQLGNNFEARRDYMRAMETDLAHTNTDAIVKLADIDLLYYMLDPQDNKPLLPELKDLTQQLLKKDPKSFDGLRFSGHIARLQPDLAGAVKKFEEANQVKPFQPEVMPFLVQALFLLKRNAEGEKYANDTIDKLKNFGQMYDILYIHYVNENHPELGEQLLKQKTANNPNQGAYLLQLAFHYYMTSRKDDMTAALNRLTSNQKTFPDGRMLAGDFYVRMRDFDHALQQYDQGLKDDPKNKRAYQKKMVEVLGTQGKTEQASKIVAALLKDDPKDPETIAMHATLLLQGGDKRQIKNVISELQPLVSKMPGNAILHYNLGRAYLVASDPQSLDQARIQFLEALKIEPRYVPAMVALANLDLTRGNHSQAVQEAERALEVDHTNQAAMLIRGAGLASMQQRDKAREQFTNILKMYPNSNDAHFQLAMLNYYERNYKDMEAEFQTLLKANDPRGLPGIIEAKVGQGQWDQALKFGEQIVAQSPSRDDYRLALANTYFRAGKYAESSAQYQKLIEKDPKSAELYIRLGESRRYGGDNNAAIDALNKAKTIEPGNVAIYQDLGMLYESLGRSDDARKSYEEVIKLKPDDGMALNNLAYLKADSGVDLDQALEYAERARQKLPDNLEVMDTLALIYIRKNLTDDGLRMLRDLVNRKPDSPTFHLHLALALYQKGDRPTAKKELEKAKGYKPNEKEQNEIKQLMLKVG